MAGMKIILSTAAILLALASCRHTSSEAGALQIEDFARDVDAARVELQIPGLSVAVVREGKVILARGFGMSDVEQRVAATADTVYPIGSITKTFTATLMMQLADRGRLDLEQPVARYVDWEVATEIRIRHVLSHTSEGTPGTRFVYSSRFNWLDNVVEAATKEKFRELLIANVIAPAGLTRTYSAEETEGLAKPYRADGTPSQLPPLALHSSSGLSSTVLDLAQYSVALDAGKLLQSTRMYEPSAPGMPYGYGWFTQQVAGERVVWHTSWWPDAFSGLLVKVPSRGLTLVLLANTDALVAPQRGASNVLLYPIARTFLQTFLDRGVRLDRSAVSDDDRLKLYDDLAAGDRLIAKFPEDVNLRFDVALAYGRVRPSLRINGEHSARAFALLDELVRGTHPLPKWMDAWSSYLVAEHLGTRDPIRTRQLAERAKASGVNTDALQARIEALLATIP